MQLFSEIPTSVPTPVALLIGAGGLAAGLIWMRAAVRDKLSKARDYMRISVRYGTRGDTALAKIRAIDTPTMQVPIIELRAATETPIEAARRRVAELVDQVQEAVNPAPAPRDWAAGEMAAAFNKIVDDNEWEPSATHTQPGNVSPWVSPVPARTAPVPSAPPAIVHAPRGPQTPPRWVDGGTPPPASRGRTRIAQLAPRERDWNLFGRMPRLELPAFPEPFRMPTQRLRPDPRVLAHLPADPTRAYRTRTVQA